MAGRAKTVLFMSSSYETCRGNATQDKRKGRRAVLATSDDFGRINRTGHLLGGAPPTTGWAGCGAHGPDTHHGPGTASRVPPRTMGYGRLPQMLPEKLRRAAPG